ncbi:sulfurtransferase [Plantibacter cousiniae (nom. nud.)]|uniref:sulfurtransferase n=1 Tax=Plantibacter cousiniae (nom. nud.) TaxID=199709 RepID=UPI001D1B4413|nr:sulfurtransferase [Plantibacter cousiniae]CAH0136871.1 Putative thiosulfate sulfurtransferase SseB [Plantibacter cousiniae]
MPILIAPDDLAALIASGTPVRVLDVRWRLDAPDGRPAYLEAHVPGAVYVDLDHELADHVPTGEPAVRGRHPLPDREALQASARSWGVDDGDVVVVYDDLKSLSAARAWWVLRNAGIADVRILDGAFRAWTDAGLPVERGEVVPEPGTVTLTTGVLPTIDIDTAATWAGEGRVLLDARAGERYRGEVEPIDPRAGHIPGALSTPTTANVGADGRFLPPETLREQFLAAGVPADATVATYCGSGVTAAHNAVALTLAGFEPVLYPGSWSEWANHPERPVAMGPGA